MTGRFFICVVLYKRSACNTDGYLIYILCSRQESKDLETGVEASSPHQGKEENKAGTVL